MHAYVCVRAAIWNPDCYAYSDLRSMIFFKLGSLLENWTY